ncbi:serine/threonine protein kinase [Archangium primigenium]|uniref:serine/threonine protein kinase n=1 Tax=[Archangium] primigenium TaxID=2792470 RepID=UPI0019591120|nr:serine/threonine-protein kinase [Archangium primigenium]MBM7118374.1 serine/threonine protein kinase [Archangium primigenium]
MRDEMGGQGRRSALPLEPGARVAGFVIEGPLALGGMGFVFRARRDGRLFALKLLPMTPRNERELEALRRLHHPNVVGFRGWAQWPDEAPRFHVLALEFVEGRPLEVWAAEENPSALELVHRFLLPFTLTLARVHDAGVVHRDVKEANILMREGDGQPVLVDFGAAWLPDAPRMTPRLPPGTPEYRSPEALRLAREWTGEPLPMSPREDLWALGVTLYGLLTRELPFGDREGPLTQAILFREPDAPHLLNLRVPPVLSEVCLRLLAKQPEARFPDARALAHALTEAFSRADRSWREPLFPPSPPAVPEGGPDARPRRRRVPRSGALLLGLGVALLPGNPRPTSPGPHPPRQAMSRQEVAPGRMTGEVAPGAIPRTSTPPAPAAVAASGKDTEMMTSKKSRSVARAAVLAGVACVGPGCAGSPLRKHLPPEECPAGSEATLDRLGLAVGMGWPAYLKDTDPASREPFAVEEGPIAFQTGGQWVKLKNDSVITGRLLFGKDRVYARITRVHLETGEVLPICLDIVSDEGPVGLLMQKGSTPRRALVINTPWVRVVSRFKSP